MCHTNEATIADSYALGLIFFFGGIEENGHCDLGFIFHQCEEIL